MSGNASIHAVDKTNTLDNGKVKWIAVGAAQNGALLTNADFVPSSYDADLTMNGSAQGVALATGATKIRVQNRGVTTEAIRVAFGTSELNAEANLTYTTAAATGFWIGAAVDGFDSAVVLGVPADATHYAVGNAVASDVQVVSVTQGV